MAGTLSVMVSIHNNKEIEKTNQIESGSILTIIYKMKINLLQQQQLYPKLKKKKLK